MENLIITAAISGAEVSKKSNPAVPYTIEELVNEAEGAFKAGAAVIHVHVRKDDGTPTQDKERFRLCLDAIQEACPGVIIIPTTGGAMGMSAEERLSPTELYPEMATLDCGTCNFGEEIFENTLPMMRQFGKRMLENKIKPEYECFERGHVDTILKLAKEGLVPGGSMQFNFVLGVGGCTPATIPDLCWLVQSLPSNATWTGTGIGKNTLAIAAASIAMGGHVRVGLEDNVYIRKGQLAKSNAELVKQVVDLAKIMGRPIATPEQARKILGLQLR